MKEDFLHYVWQYKLFAATNLQTTSKESVSVLKVGMHNKNAGPDFLNAKLRINNQLWVGNVEIHLNASDWYLHQHENDKNYDATILHVVWEHDTTIFMNNNQPLPTLVLKEIVDNGLLEKYRNLVLTNPLRIPCETSIHQIDSFVFDHWQERLYFERLEHKSSFIYALLKHSNNDFEAVLFQLLVKNFGLKVNGDAFLSLAHSFDFSILRKVQSNKETLAALLFGQAGFLDDDIDGVYYQHLKKEYSYLKHKFNLQSISKNQFLFFRMRPPNFPTIRLAQIVAFYHQYKNIFTKVMAFRKIEEFYAFFSVEVATFWKTHYTFQTPSKKSAKRITKSLVDLLLINTIIPLKFVYEKSRGVQDENELLVLIKQIKPEKNSVITLFEDLNIPSKTAFNTQALLEMRNNYCAKKRCLECAIGNHLLKNLSI